MGGEDQPVAVETLSSLAGELEVHHVQAGLLGRQFTVQTVLVVAGPLPPRHLLCLPDGEIHGEMPVMTVWDAGDGDQTVSTGLTAVLSISNTLYFI